MSHRRRYFFNFLGLLIISLLHVVACRHFPKKPEMVDDKPINLFKKNISLVFVAEIKRFPSYIIYEKHDYYAFKNRDNMPFKIDLAINPLMRNAKLVATVLKNGKVESEIVATEAVSAQMSNKKTLWTPTGTKIALVVPHVGPDIIVQVKTTYEWMDIRWLPPQFLEEEGFLPELTLNVDVPHGITLHFKAAKDRESFDAVPSKSEHQNTLWVDENNRAGLGMRYSWETKPRPEPKKTRGDFLQLFLSFETPTQKENTMRFNNWSDVSTYLYNHIDRFDMYSNEIREFSLAEAKNYASPTQKIFVIFAFLRNFIEKRAIADPFQDQSVQLATRTFARRFGTPFDIAILGKAMLNSIGLAADLIAVADRRYNPEITDFFSPALFYSVLLSASDGEKNYYFDPDGSGVSLDQLDPNRQGQPALTIRPTDGTAFFLPFDNVHKNQTIISYQLWLNEDGLLEGDYAIDLIGYESSPFLKIPDDQLRAMSPAIVEEKVFLNKPTPFSLETSEFSRMTYADGIRLFGLVRPRILPKNPHGAFEYRLDKIIEPILRSVEEVHIKGYPTINRISLYITMPTNFVVNNVPSIVNWNYDGIEGRASATFFRDQLVVESISMITFPVKKDILLSVQNELNNLKQFGAQNMIIEHVSDVTHAAGAPDGQEEWKPEEDS